FAKYFFLFFSVTASSSSVLTEILQCLICLELSTDPMMTPCGHNFCKACLKECWESSHDNTCPCCKEDFSKRVDLRHCGHLLSQSEILMCQITMLDLVEDINPKIIQKYNRLVEYYCLDDRVLVCMSCAIEERHRLHNMKTLQTAHVELASQLKEEIKTLAQKKNQLTETGSTLKDLVFTRLQTSVSARLGAHQTAQRAIRLALEEDDDFSFLQKFASVHEAIMEARTVDLKQGLESGPECTKLIKEIRKDGEIIEEQVHKLQRRFLAFADPEFHSVVQDDQNPVSELTFDPQTLGPEMTLSKNLKTVFYSFSARNLTQASAGSYGTQTLRCLQTNNGVSLHWFLKLSEHFDWTIGLCDTRATNGNYSVVYGLRKQKNSLFSLESEDETQSGSTYRYVTGQALSTRLQTLRSPCLHDFLVTGPWKVEVIWDYASKQLAFYSRNKQTKGLLLCKLKTDIYGQTLCPFITFENITTTLQNTQRELLQIAQTYPRMSKGQGSSYTEILCVLKQ
uniref:Si:dkey-183c6.9 n=1 Tax=Cyprinus carpio TaxID=7962 RepID=A0A8C2AX22_CYPCA